MLIYAHHITPRLQYTADFIALKLCGTKATFTSSKEEFLTCDDVKINYSNEPLAAGLQITPQGLLMQKNICLQEITCFDWKNTKAFFSTSDALGFDIFSAIFYLLSRYEEYLPHQQDRFGRYAHENSLAYKENFLHQPVVDQWLVCLASILKEKFPTSDFRPLTFKFLPTYDIDEAFAYTHRGFVRTIGAIAKSVFAGHFSLVKKRLRVLLGKAKDPYDIFDELDLLHKENKLMPIYFFHVGLKYGQFDKNILPQKKIMQLLIKRHCEYYQIGLHPSWRSGDEKTQLQQELQWLEAITGKKQTHSRQHYLRFNLPDTYRRLIDAGIRQEFSMGYGAINGFRASTASPFYWYDLPNEQATALLIHPFAFMESTSMYKLKQSPNEAIAEMQKLHDAVKKSGGRFISIWHNSSLGTMDCFKDWSDAYKRFLKKNR